MTHEYKVGDRVLYKGQFPGSVRKTAILGMTKTRAIQIILDTNQVLNLLHDASEIDLAPLQSS
jgi:hypothetical protein